MFTCTWDNDRTVNADYQVSQEVTISTARHTFTKADRLLKRSEFIRIGQQGKKRANREFIVYFCANQHSRCRLGITVSRKVGKAATRNTIKRLIREFFRLNRQRFKNHWDLHVIGKKAAAYSSHQRVFSSLEELFKKIELFQED